jgi:cytochrome c oxidase assembly factor CtaG
VTSADWTLDPAVLTLAGLAAVLFAQAFVRLRRRGRSDHASWSRAVLFAAALAAMTLPLVSPLDRAADTYLLSAHMLEHVLIGDVAPALVVLALRGPLLFFFVPAAPLAALARSRPLRAAARLLLRPRAGLAVWALVFAAWHVPAAYDYTLTHQGVHDLEHATFALAGLLVWSQLVDPARRHALGVGGRLTYAVVLFGMGALLSAVLIVAPHALYPAYAAQPHRLFALSPLADQRLAGVVMLAEQTLSLGACVAFLLGARARGRSEPGLHRRAAKLSAGNA